MIIAAAVALLLILLAIGAPVGFAMAISGALGLYLQGGFTLMLGILDTAPLSTANAYVLVTIPMFMLMAEFVLASEVADDLFAAAAIWLGRLKGSLGMATAVAGAGFAAICGSSTASAATLASTTLPAMIRQGYEPGMASGVVAISGTLAMLIPPAIAMVVYALLADVSLAKLLVAGIIPGIVVTIAIMGTVWVLVWLDPSRAPVPKPASWGAKFTALRGVFPMLLLFTLITSAIYTGFATPTETSAFGALGALLLLIWRGKANRKTLWNAISGAALSSCMITMILLGAHIFSYFMAATQLTTNLISWVGALDVNRWVILILILCGYIALGAIMDQMAILVLTVPIIVPLISKLGFDLIWFGVIKIVVAEMGLITPPIGLNCFVVARCADRPVAEVFRGTFPHFIAHILVIALFLLLPGLILWLPSRM